MKCAGLVATGFCALKPGGSTPANMLRKRTDKPSRRATQARHMGTFFASFCLRVSGVILEQLLQRRSEYAGYAKSYVKRGGVLVSFDGDDGLAGNADLFRKLL